MAISEFRFNKKRKHPSYVFKNKHDKYHSILITHSQSSPKYKKNIKLTKNPKPNDNTTAYLVPKVYKDNISSYGKKSYKNWKFSRNDNRKVKRIQKGKKV